MLESCFPGNGTPGGFGKDFIDLRALKGMELHGDMCISFLLLFSLCFPILPIMSERKLGCQGPTQPNAC